MSWAMMLVLLKPSVSNTCRSALRKRAPPRHSSNKSKFVHLWARLSYVDRMQSYENDLRGTMYRNIEARYRENLIKVRATELAISDMNLYYRTLDKYDQCGIKMPP